MKIKPLRFLVAAALAAPAVSFATTGYFAHGYGLKAKGMGGVGIALPQETLSGVANPANLGFVGNRMDLELEWFRPIREGQVSGTGFIDGNFNASGRKDFLIPGFGYNRMLRPDLALGVLVYGNGGMNTTFGTNPFGGALGGTNPGGVDYMQLFIAPTLAWKPNENHSIGVSLNLVYQQFAAQGLEGFGAFGLSSDPAKLTNKGRDDSTGIGLRLGWTGKITPNLTLGAMYQPKTNMGKLGDYAGLFRNGGDLDIPATYGAGFAVKATPQLTIAGDIQQIDYAKVPAIGVSPDCLLNTVPVPTCQLGASNGPGFGWRNMTAYKIGASYEVSRSLTVRAGYVTGKQPIPTQHTLLNIIFPAIMEDHVTLGATWNMGTIEITAGYMHALKKTVNGAIPLLLGGAGQSSLRMYQDSLGVAVGWRM